MKLKEKMANAKAYVQKNQKKFILMMCSIVIVGGMVAGTLAWLAARTNPVINNFIGSDLTIDLYEEAQITNPETGNPTFQMIPGDSISKNPKVKVLEGSEACWLFLQVKESPAQANGSNVKVDGVPRNGEDYKYLEYNLVPPTTDDHTGVGWHTMTADDLNQAGFPATDPDGSVNTYYYREVGANGTAITQDIEYDILKPLPEQPYPDRTVHVKVENYIINAELTPTQLQQNPVKITFTPIAIQRLGFETAGSAGYQIADKFVVDDTN